MGVQFCQYCDSVQDFSTMTFAKLSKEYLNMPITWFATDIKEIYLCLVSMETQMVESNFYNIEVRTSFIGEK